MQMKSLLALSIVALALPASLWAEEAHHPKPAEETAPAATQAPEMGTGMMAMMPDMMRMMQEMGDPTRHVEGRIAFLHAELAITKAQEPLWASLADALRQNAAGMAQAAPADHGHDTSSVVVGQLLDQQHALETRLDGLRAVNAALKPLADALSEEQRATLDALFPHVSGMMPMQEMMPAQELPGTAPLLDTSAVRPRISK